MDDFFEDLDGGKVSLMLLLDFSRAFDTINHLLLCAKLKFSSGTREALNFFSCYLWGRMQIVVFGDTLISIASVTSGVPQSLILGPVLFVLYSMLIPNNTKVCWNSAYDEYTQLRYSFIVKNFKPRGIL